MSLYNRNCIQKFIYYEFDEIEIQMLLLGLICVPNSLSKPINFVS